MSLITDRKQVWLEIGSGGVHLGLKRLSPQLREGVLRAVGLDDRPGSTFRLDPLPDLQPLIDYCTKNAELFDEATDGDPAPPDPVPPPTDIGELSYPEPVVARLRALGGSREGAPRKGASLSLRFQRVKNGGTAYQILRLDMYAGGKLLVLRMHPDLGARFLGSFPRAAVLQNTRRYQTEVTGESGMTSALDWVAKELSST